MTKFDAVVSGYLVRNVIDIPQALSEQKRILKAGGTDCDPWIRLPRRKNILRPFILIHLKYVIPVLGRIIGGKEASDAYTYLPESTQAFKTPDELVSLMQDAGFVNVKYNTFMFGTMAVHWGEKSS